MFSDAVSVWASPQNMCKIFSLVPSKKNSPEKTVTN